MNKIIAIIALFFVMVVAAVFGAHAADYWLNIPFFSFIPTITVGFFHLLFLCGLVYAVAQIVKVLAK